MQPSRAYSAIALAFAFAGVTAATGFGLAASSHSARADATITLSIVGTTDIHGFVLPSRDRGGLALFAGYVENLRAARSADGRAALLVDAGDTFQGGVESNLSEGALVVDAFNTLGYTAAAMGNHEFDFGAADGPGAREDPEADRQSAIKARAAQAGYPVLAANLLDKTTGRRVEWPNVRPSVLVEAAGVKVGIVGVMTAAGLRSTIAANVAGLDLAPLVPSIASEATSLRSAGADLVVVVAHAGGSCMAFDDPANVTSCDQSSEIFQVARALPAGLVDVIAAGHTHDAVAHIVNGIAIVQAYPFGRAFARADVTLSADTHKVLSVRPFAPHGICAQQFPGSSQCADASSGAPVAQYEGRIVHPVQTVVDAMAPALARVRHLQAAELGATLDGPLPRTADAESPLGNLFADALRRGAGADVAITGGRAFRADLPPGRITLGALYDAFPFDNRVMRLRLTGAALKGLMLEEFTRGRAGGLGVSGLQVEANCDAGGLQIRLTGTNGDPVRDEQMLTLAAIEGPVPGPPIGSANATSAPLPHAYLAREIVEDWLREHPTELHRETFVNRLSRRVLGNGGTAADCGAR